MDSRDPVADVPPAVQFKGEHPPNPWTISGSDPRPIAEIPALKRLNAENLVEVARGDAITRCDPPLLERVDAGP
ncbi:hypothetical protein [Nannocystis punicea]|uniref:Uncharacterized protein n=1 Tax=Nannocystis punicea TaxID=2995304 RepID=A0ABY7H972_9BACT|nr:hypothetical protein [Nannocystis poenicansa]WAS95812.1 hypothetical protein O0S08_06580 [Nannocystis poenicansa]